jgi:hypothetical protein
MKPAVWLISAPAHPQLVGLTKCSCVVVQDAMRTCEYERNSVQQRSVQVCADTPFVTRNKTRTTQRDVRLPPWPMADPLAQAQELLVTLATIRR